MGSKDLKEEILKAFLVAMNEKWFKHDGDWYDDEFDDQELARRRVKHRNFQDPDDPDPSQLLRGEELVKQNKKADADWERRVQRRDRADNLRQHKKLIAHLQAIAAGGKDAPRTELEKEQDANPEKYRKAAEETRKRVQQAHDTPHTVSRREQRGITGEETIHIRNAVLNYLNEVNARDGKRNVAWPMNRPMFRGTTDWDTRKTTPLKRNSPLWKKGAMKKHNADMDAVMSKRAVRADKKKVRDFAEKNARRDGK
tara:strand:+ start:901 stop:1665 length:765 start_codon:yes stop_codon:yes gene_type:complete